PAAGGGGGPARPAPGPAAGPPPAPVAPAAPAAPVDGAAGAADRVAAIAGWTDAQTADMLRARGGLKWTSVPAGAIGAGVAEMDLPLAPAITAALHEAVDRGLTGYLPPGLADGVAAATARWQARSGWAVDPADVHPVASVVTGFRIVLEHLTDPRAPVVLPVPAYMPFLTVPALAGRELRTVPMRIVDGPDDGPRYELDLPAIAAALTPGAVVVLTNPHNPTGRVFTTDELLALAEVVDAAEAVVFADEIHAPLTMPGFTHHPYAALSAATAAHTITGVSASKGWNIPGLGCGQLILSSTASRAAWEQLDPFTRHGGGVTPLGAVATAAAYTAGVDHLAGCVQYLAAGRDLFAAELARHLPAAHLFPVEGTYLGWLDLRAVGADPATVGEKVGVYGVDGTACGVPGFLRVNLAMPHPLLRDAARRLGRLA
ncbi:MalY/PatB family protein, partial [Nakamurella sp.]|uniref:MalY/PatB family protein n=1 Tax=Nakamurella sp. TaxID=1869182 RepID=UPI003B3B2ED4